MKSLEPVELAQVFYISHSLATPSDLQAILAACLRNNPLRGLTGALLFTGGAFAQVLEGPVASVHAMSAAIGADPRHQGVRWLLERRSTQRRFGNWTMKLLETPGADDLVQELLFGPTVAVERAERLIELMFGMPPVLPAQFGATAVQACSSGARNS